MESVQAPCVKRCLYKYLQRNSICTNTSGDDKIERTHIKAKGNLYKQIWRNGILTVPNEKPSDQQSEEMIEEQSCWLVCIFFVFLHVIDVYIFFVQHDDDECLFDDDELENDNNNNNEFNYKCQRQQ